MHIMERMFSIVLASSHLLFVVFIAVVIATSTDPVAVNAWLLFIPIDFPISMGLFPIGHVFNGDLLISAVNTEGQYSIFRDIDNFWLQALYFGIFGTLQWYCIPVLLSKFINWLRNGKHI